MDITEVTVNAYRACSSCSAPGSGGYCNWGSRNRGNHPVNCIDWLQASAYCKAVAKRLPTEEEWEYAARGVDGREYPWGNEPPEKQLCWVGEGSDLGKGNRNTTCPVGSYPAGRSLFGLDDMSGNVWEWTSSLYDTSKTYDTRVLRGGGWNFGKPVLPSDVRVSNRVGEMPSNRGNSSFGCRCARGD
ncbi:MAG: SUMF1/EgtB/PvdO family nonheme iron enzyme [Myxococcales bacterium]